MLDSDVWVLTSTRGSSPGDVSRRCLLHHYGHWRLPYDSIAGWSISTTHNSLPRWWRYRCRVYVARNQGKPFRATLHRPSGTFRCCSRRRRGFSEWPPRGEDCRRTRQGLERRTQVHRVTRQRVIRTSWMDSLVAGHVRSECSRPAQYVKLRWNHAEAAAQFREVA